MKCFPSSLPLDTSASSHCEVRRVRDRGLAQRSKPGSAEVPVLAEKENSVTPWVFTVGEWQAVRALANSPL